MAHDWTAVSIVLKWLAGFWLFWRIEGCEPPDANPSPETRHPKPRVSIIIPARNEELKLPKLLHSLAEQTPPPDQVIVVNDHSMDSTPQIAQRAGARVLDAQDPPAGWIGKTWACWTGAKAATGDLLVFMDADTWLMPGGLEAMVCEHRRRGGLLSIYPTHRMQRFYERLSAFLQIVTVMGLGIAALGFSGWKRRNAFGQCLLFRREDYFSIGGHEAVRNRILEGPAFGERFFEKGWPVHCLAGRDVVEVRMYPEGLRQMVEGWSKNFQSGAKASGVLLLSLIILWLTGFFDVLRLPIQAGMYAAFALQLHWMLRRIGNFGWVTAFAFPIPLLFFVAVFLYWLVSRFVFRRVCWRGRTISVFPPSQSF